MRSLARFAFAFVLVAALAGCNATALSIEDPAPLPSADDMAMANAIVWSNSLGMAAPAPEVRWHLDCVPTQITVDGVCWSSSVTPSGIDVQWYGTRISDTDFAVALWEWRFHLRAGGFPYGRDINWAAVNAAREDLASAGL